MKVGQIKHDIFSVPGRKVNRLLPETSYRRGKTCLVPGTSYFLPLSDMSGEMIDRVCCLCLRLM